MNINTDYAQYQALGSVTHIVDEVVNVAITEGLTEASQKNLAELQKDNIE